MIGTAPDGGEDIEESELKRIRAQRRKAVSEASRTWRCAVMAAFRTELGAVVTTASPFAMALLHHEGTSMDAVSWRIEPAMGWLPALRIEDMEDDGDLEPLGRVRSVPGDEGRWIWPAPTERHGVDLPLASGGSARLQVSGRTLAITARLGGVRLLTSGGLLLIRAGSVLPSTLAASCVGRRVGDVVSHPSLMDENWRIETVDERGCVTLLVRTGLVAYRLPWVR